MLFRSPTVIDSCCYSVARDWIYLLVVGLCGKALVAGGHRGGFCEKNLEAAPCLVRAPLLTRAELISDVVLRLCESIFKTGEKKKKKHCTTQQLGE